LSRGSSLSDALGVVDLPDQVGVGCIAVLRESFTPINRHNRDIRSLWRNRVHPPTSILEPFQISNREYAAA